MDDLGDERLLLSLDLAVKQMGMEIERERGFHHLRNYSSAMHAQRYFDRVLFRVAFALVFVLPIVTVALLGLRARYDLWAVVAAALPTGAGAAIAGILLLALLEKGAQLLDIPRILKSIFVSAVLLAASFVVGRQPLHFLQAIPLYFACTVLISALATSLVVLLGSLAKRRYAVALARRDPLAFLVGSLVDLVAHLESGGELDAFSSIATRCKAIECLETAARSLERIGRVIFTKPADLDEWTLTAFRERANGIRQLIGWVGMPLKSTRSDLIGRLNAILVALLGNDWGNLQRVARPGDTGGAWKRLVWRSGAKIVIALGPITFLLAAKWLPETFGGAFDKTTYLFALIWAMTSLVTMFNPGLGETIKFCREVTSALTPKKPSAKDD